MGKNGYFLHVYCKKAKPLSKKCFYDFYMEIHKELIRQQLFL